MTTRSRVLIFLVYFCQLYHHKASCTPVYTEADYETENVSDSNVNNFIQHSLEASPFEFSEADYYEDPTSLNLEKAMPLTSTTRPEVENNNAKNNELNDALIYQEFSKCRSTTTIPPNFEINHDEVYKFAEPTLQIFSELRVACDGWLTQWRFLAKNPIVYGLHLAVFRRRGSADIFDIVGESYLRALATPESGHDTWIYYPLKSKPIAVAKGDMLGFYYDNYQSVTDMLTVGAKSKFDLKHHKTMRPTYVMLLDNLTLGKNKTVDARMAYVDIRQPALAAIISPINAKDAITTEDDDDTQESGPITSGINRRPKLDQTSSAVFITSDLEEGDRRSLIAHGAIETDYGDEDEEDSSYEQTGTDLSYRLESNLEKETSTTTPNVDEADGAGKTDQDRKSLIRNWKPSEVISVDDDYNYENVEEEQESSTTTTTTTTTTPELTTVKETTKLQRMMKNFKKRSTTLSTNHHVTTTTFATTSLVLNETDVDNATTTGTPQNSSTSSSTPSQKFNAELVSHIPYVVAGGNVLHDSVKVQSNNVSTNASVTNHPYPEVYSGGVISSLCLNPPTALYECPKKEIRFYFDYETAVCRGFYGCESWDANVANNFNSVPECEAKCKQPATNQLRHRF